MDQFNQRDIKIGEGRGGGFDGGVITVKPPALLPFGSWSQMVNVKKWHPGIQIRGGMTPLFSDSELEPGSSGPGIMTLYQFSKGERHEIHTYAQTVEGKVIQFSNNPPIVTTGYLGGVIFTTSGNPNDQVSASWSDNRDVLVFSNGVDQHQLYPGQNQKIGAFIKYENPFTLPTRIPENGKDFTDLVLENNGIFATTYIDYNATEAMFIMTPLPANVFSWILNAPATGSNPSNSLRVRYINTAGDWAVVPGFIDSTYASGKSWGQSGNMQWTHPTDEAPTYMFGQSGYWYKIDLNNSFPWAINDIKPLQITYSGGWRPMDNVWDGILVDVVEAQLYDQSLNTYDTYPASTINISLMTNLDKLYIGTADPAYGFYIDVGDTPNTTGTSVITVKKSDGDFFNSVVGLEDQTLAFKKSGFISWKKDDAAFKTQFNGQQGYLYWYEIGVNATTADNIIISALYLPQTYMGKEFGTSGICNSVWKNRSVFTNSIFDRDIYVSANGRPNVLNGLDFAILEPGDGRRNRTCCIKKFHNEIIAWQIEKGRDGGCTTLFEGYSPSTFGKLVLSSQVGTFNAQSAVVIDGATTTTKNDDKFQTMAYWISHYGIFMTDGRVVTMVSQDIQNYFDNDFVNDCIRIGYEEKMWVEHDVDRGVLRFGLVSGPVAEAPNIFPIFDLEDGTWSFDTFGRQGIRLSCALQCESETNILADGQTPIIHIGATEEGGVHLLNKGFVDYDRDVSLSLTMELNHVGFLLNLREIILRTRTELLGSFLKYIRVNGKFISKELEYLPLQGEESGDIMRRYRILERMYQETSISITLGSDLIGDAHDLYFYDLNFDIEYELNQ